jgi:hypothetical protein
MYTWTVRFTLNDSLIDSFHCERVFENSPKNLKICASTWLGSNLMRASSTSVEKIFDTNFSVEMFARLRNYSCFGILILRNATFLSINKSYNMILRNCKVELNLKYETELWKPQDPKFLNKPQDLFLKEE